MSPQTSIKSYPSDPPFSRHTDSVLCCALDPSSQYAVSGGIDEKAFVWDVSTRQVRFICTGHKESVVACGFSLKGTYVGTGDMNGYLQVRNVNTGNKVFDIEIEEINWIIWHNHLDNVILAGTMKGDFWMWNIADPQAVRYFQSYGSSASAARLLADGVKLVVAYGDGSVRIFNLKTRELVHHVSGKGEEIASMDLSPDGSLVAVGCMDCTAQLISVSTGKRVATLQCTVSRNDSPDKPADQSFETIGLDEIEAEDEEEIDEEELEIIESNLNLEQEDGGVEVENDDDDDGDTLDVQCDEIDPYDLGDLEEAVESVAFSLCGSYLATSTTTGGICVWDVSGQSIRARLHLGEGITRSFWDEKNRYLCFCLDGIIRLFNHNLEKLGQVDEHADQILDCQAKNGTLVTASEDKTCRVYDMSELI